MGDMSLLVILLVLMIIGAIIAIETTNLLSSIVCVGAVGFMISIAFLFLGAPDLAITQLVVEALCLIILIRATINRDLTSVTGDREFFGLTVTVAMVLVLAIVGIKAFAEFPLLGQPVMDRMADTSSAVYLAQGTEQTGARNVVTALMLGYRNYDALGQVAVLFCSVLGALAILRRPARKEEIEKDQEADAV
jgi:multicomponent Na+:H+ antiporter subunit B